MVVRFKDTSPIWFSKKGEDLKDSHCDTRSLENSSRERSRTQSSPFTEDNIGRNRHQRQGSREANQEKVELRAIDLCYDCLEVEREVEHGSVLTLTGQHEARVFHLNPPHLGLQEELEINAFGLRGGGEKSSRDSRSVFVVFLTKAQAEKDIFRIFLHLVQNLWDAEKWGFG